MVETWTPIRDAGAWAGLIYLIGTLGFTLGLRVIFEGGLYWTRWKAFKVGDFALSLFALFAGIALQDYQRHIVVLDHPAWIWVVVLGTALFVLNMEFDAVEKRFRPIKNARLPSQMWHSAMFIVFAAWIVDALPPLISIAFAGFSPMVWLAFLSLGFYAVTLFILDRNGWNLGPERVPRGLSSSDDPDR